MKKVFVAAFLLASVTGFSQSLTGGLKGGVNVSNFTGGNFQNVNKKALIGFHAGGFLNIAFGGFSIQPEALVSTQGAKAEDVTGGSYDFKLTYITVPIMAKIRTGGGFYLEAGPQFGFKISEDVGNSTINDFAKNLDLSIGAGLGFQSAGGFGIGARYLAGLSKVGDFSGVGNMDPDFKNSVIQAGIFWAFGK
jgi:hypothetical protein